MVCISCLKYHDGWDDFLQFICIWHYSVLQNKKQSISVLCHETENSDPNECLAEWVLPGN
jgi:hypothetical protein